MVTEQYKLTGNPGSVWLFTVLSDWLHVHGYEKPFRLAVASAEILASVLVVIPWTRIVGAALALGVMSGAIFFHTVSPLGIDPYTTAERCSNGPARSGYVPRSSCWCGGNRRLSCCVARCAGNSIC